MVAPVPLLLGPLVVGGGGRVDWRVIDGADGLCGGMFFARYGAVRETHYHDDELVCWAVEASVCVAKRRKMELEEE